jgi:hypothetical protein
LEGCRRDSSLIRASSPKVRVAKFNLTSPDQAISVLASFFQGKLRVRGVAKQPAG